MKFRLRNLPENVCTVKRQEESDAPTIIYHEVPCFWVPSTENNLLPLSMSSILVPDNKTLTFVSCPLSQVDFKNASTGWRWWRGCQTLITIRFPWQPRQAVHKLTRNEAYCTLLTGAVTLLPLNTIIYCSISQRKALGIAMAGNEPLVKLPTMLQRQI